MRKKSLIAVAAIAVLTLIGILVRQVAFAKEPAAYRFATITRGDMKATVSATGTLNAVTTVSVGTQVSGQVAALYADFNDHVKKGQLLARIDPTLQKQAVQDAQAQLERAQAQAAQSSAEYARNKQLYDQKVITASEFGTVQSSAAVDAANVVNYTAVVSVQNSSGKLLPGMTATVDFLTGQAGDALLVPNTALRFRATPEMLAAAGVQQGQWTSRRDSTGGTATGAPATG